MTWMNACPANIYTLPTLDFIGGSTQDLLFHTYFERNGRPFDLSSCVANFAIISFLNKTGRPLVSKPMSILDGDMDDGSVISNVLTITLDPNDTINLPSGKYIYQITIKDITGIVEPPQQGTMRIWNNINKSFAIS